MSHWYSGDWMKFKKVSKTEYIYGEYAIVNVRGYHFAFYKNYLLNREQFSKEAAYHACLYHAGKPLNMEAL
jgi:hypothetical protein